MGKVKNSPKKSKNLKKKLKYRLLTRAEKIWRLVNIEGYTYGAAWKMAYPVSKAKKRNWSRLGKRACDLFEKTYGEDLQKLLEAAGMGLSRVVMEISKNLVRKKIELYKGKIIEDDKTGDPKLFDDNFIQYKACELLAKIHGLEKMKMEHTILNSFYDIMKEADKEDADSNRSNT